MIIRTPKKAHFTVISNALIEDQRLSWAATGLLIYLLSKPDHWRILPAQLIKERHLGRDGVYRLLKELELAGYVQKHQVKNSAGRMTGTDWCVFDEPRAATPHPEKPDMDAPHPELPYPVNPPLINTDISAKTEVNKHTHTDRTAQESHEPVEPAQSCVCTEAPSRGESREEEKAEALEPVVAPRGQRREGGGSQPVEVITQSRPPVAAESIAVLTAAVPAVVPSTQVGWVEEQPAPSATPPAARLVSPSPPKPTSVTVAASPPRSPASASIPATARPSAIAPLDEDEQEAFAWAAGHPFWHSRITNPENLRRNFQEGKAFHMQFLDARDAKALASGTNTDQGLGDLAENHTVYRGYYHAENQRDLQSSQATGDPGSFHPGHVTRTPASERQHPLSAAERVRLAGLQYLAGRGDRDAQRELAQRSGDGYALDPAGGNLPASLVV